MEISTTAWLTIAFGFGVLFAGLILFEASRQLPNSIPGGRTWAQGNFLLFGGLLLLGLRSLLPEIIPVLVGNTLLIAATLLFFLAFSKILGKKPSLTPGLIITGATLIGLSYFLFVKNDYGMRVIIISVAIIATNGMSFFLFVPLKNDEYKTTHRIILITYFFSFLMLAERIMVVLVNRDKDPSFFDNNIHIIISLMMITVIVIVMTFAFVLLSNTQNYQNIHKLAYLDELTQTYSRRAILDHGNASINQSNRSLIPFSVLLIDLDDLKGINDQHGHLAGDEALLTITSIARSNLRDEDAIGRYGGDEFIIILRNTNLKGAENIVLRLINELDKNNQISPRQVHVSVGICQYSPGTGTFTDVLEKADQALYSAKQFGENSYNICPET